jgi:hypothetical protein
MARVGERYEHRYGYREEKGNMAFSFNPDLATDQSFGIQEGNVRIVGAAVEVVQYAAARDTGLQAPPVTALVVELQKLDEQWNDSPDGTVKVELPIGKPQHFTPSDDGESSSGSEVGVSGPYCIETGSGKADKKSKSMEFMKSLAACGFKKELLGNDARVIIGTEGHIVTKNISGGGRIKDYTVQVFDKIVRFPYEKKGAAAGKKSAAKKAESVEDLYTEVLAAMEETFADAAEVKATALRTRALAWFMKNKKEVDVPTRKDAVEMLLADPGGIAVTE